MQLDHSYSQEPIIMNEAFIERTAELQGSIAIWLYEARRLQRVQLANRNVLSFPSRLQEGLKATHDGLKEILVVGKE